MPLDWKKDYATYDEKIDEQHKQLFRFANKIETLLERDEIDPEEVDRILQFMKVYANNHFQYEENCMRKHRCPFAKRNRNAHAAFSTYFENAAKSFRRSQYDKTMLEKLHGFVTNWLTGHICEIDIQLREYN